MSYQYDLADFKKFLNDKNASYRVDGLIFWQNRIPLPIDLFNRIFNESDLIVTDFVYQMTARAVVFNKKISFEKEIGIPITELPKSDLAKIRAPLENWLDGHLPVNSIFERIAYESADLLGLNSCSKY